MIRAVVVSHQSQAHLHDCLLSLRAAHAEVAGALECVVVDSGSSDGGPALVEREFPEVRLLRAENIGFGAACNLGARAAQAESLLFLNPDARLCTGALSALVEELDRDDRLGLVAPQLRYPNGALQFGWMPGTGVGGELVQKLRNMLEGWSWNHSRFPRLARRIAGAGWYTGACLLVRRRAFEQLTGFDEDFFLYFEDSDLCQRLTSAGWRMAQVRAAEVWHDKGASAHAGVPLAYRRSQWRFYDKHRPAWEQALLQRLLRRKLAPEDWPWRA